MARRDRREAESYYGSRSPQALRRFRSELSDALDFIATYPNGAPTFDREVRAKTVRDFPYSVLYKVVGNTIFIAAVANQHRDPNYWRERTG
jgi:plasmid stabilization system protein ParE